MVFMIPPLFCAKRRLLCLLLVCCRRTETFQDFPCRQRSIQFYAVIGCQEASSWQRNTAARDTHAIFVPRMRGQPWVRENLCLRSGDASDNAVARLPLALAGPGKAYTMIAR